jgi:MFS family permease
MLALTFSAYGTSDLRTVYALLIVSAASIVIFIIRETRIDYPLVDFRMFRIREVTGGVSAVFLNVIAWSTVLLLLSLHFQLILNESPLEAGLRILPFEIAFLAVGPLSGRLSDKFGHVRFTVSGLTINSVALFLFSTINLNTSYTILSLYMALLGIGTGLFLAPNLRGVMGSVPMQRRGIGSALVTLFLNMGLAISLNLAILVMSFTAPYSIITKIVSAINPLTISASDRILFFDSIRSTYLVLAIINAFAILPSLLQINLTKGIRKTEPIEPAHGVAE